MKTTAVVDIDWCKYSVASIGQNPYIVAIHKQTGDEWKCKNVTEFWGHHSKKAGGILAELNKGRDSPYLPEEFDIHRGYTLNPIENVLRSAKTMVEGNIKQSGASKFVAFLGEGDSFRVGLSNLSKYKNRVNEKPHYLEDVTEYLKKKFKPTVVTSVEADDACAMEAYGKKDHFILGEDKDYYSCPVRFYNVNKPEDGVVNCNQFGSLRRDSKGKVRGIGRLHLYHQCLYGDDVDTYHAAAQSSVTWGPVSAYDLLVDCKSDKEAFESLVKGYKHLYPEPVTFTSWKGEEITMDWLDCLQEIFTIAHMLRYEGDFVDVKSVLDKLNVEY